jgi:diguanylate cyclase
MLELLADFAYGIVMSSGGAGAGWLLHRAFRRAAGEVPEEQKMAREVLARLKDLAASMAARVGQHSSRIEEVNQEISQELTAGEPQGPEGVISAVARLIESNQSMQSQLGAVEDKLHEQARLVEKKAAEARTDVLTGLANRRAFDDHMAACCAEHQKSRRPFSLILGDIDHFKKFNDTHGHQTGDEVLRGTARVLHESARDTDFVARYGGEEFAILLSGTKAEEAIRALERARQAVEKALFCKGKGGDPRMCDERDATASCMNVTMSFGVAELLPGEDQKALVSRADAALYASKEAGRNRGCWHDGRTIRPIARPCDVAQVAAVATSTASACASNASSCCAAPAPSAAAEQKPEPEFKLCGKDEFGLSLGRRLAEWRRRGPAPSLLMMRIDHFDNITERYGQAIADVVLRSAMQFLTASIRSMDLGSEYGPATYTMLLPGASSTELIRVAERLRQAVARCVLPIAGQSVHFTVSLSATVAMQTDTTEQMLARVEAALNQATSAGGNCTYFHSGEKAELAVAMLERMRTAAV